MAKKDSKGGSEIACPEKAEALSAVEGVVEWEGSVLVSPFGGVYPELAEETNL